MPVRDPRAPLRQRTRRRSSRKGELMRHVFGSALSLLAMTAISSAADAELAAGTRNGDLAAVASHLPLAHPIRPKATVTLLSLQRVLAAHDPSLAPFLVDELPSRAPSLPPPTP